MIFLVWDMQKMTKKQLKSGLENRPQNDLHFGPMLGPKMDQKSSKNGSKIDQKRSPRRKWKKHLNKVKL